MNGNQESTSDPSAAPNAPANPGIKPGKKPKLTQERARELFDYREDGCLVWKVSNSNIVRVGGAVGRTPDTNGHLHVRVGGVPYLVHRVIWLWHYGYFPEHGLDHIDRDPSNNRIGNLREATQVCNSRNTGNFSHNTSGVKGVWWHRQISKWVAEIIWNQRKLSFGCHTDFSEAVAHRLAAEQCLDWEGCDNCSPAFQYMQDLKVKQNED